MNKEAELGNSDVEEQKKLNSEKASEETGENSSAKVLEPENKVSPNELTALKSAPTTPEENITLAVVDNSVLAPVIAPVIMVDAVGNAEIIVDNIAPENTAAENIAEQAEAETRFYEPALSLDTPLNAGSASQDPVSQDSEVGDSLNQQKIKESASQIGTAPRAALRMSITNNSPATFLSRIYNILAYAPFLFLSLLYLAQTFFLIDVRELWYSDEVRHADVLQHLLQSKDWVVLKLNGEFYPDKPPLYFIFLAGLHHLLLTLDELVAPLLKSELGLSFTFVKEDRLVQQLMSLGVSISGFIFLWATYIFAKVVARFDAKLCLAVGLILISSLYFIASTHYARMDLLFASLIILSQICLFKGCQKEKSSFLLLLGFIFIGLACLTKGPLGVALPLGTTVFYLFWQKRPQRIFSLDFLIGFVLACLMVSGWILLLMEHFSLEFISQNIFERQVLERALDAWHHNKAWYTYFWMFPLVFMPFSLLIFFCDLKKWLNPMALTRCLQESRQPEYQGLSFAWLSFLSGFIILSLISTKIHIYLLPLFPALAIISAKTLLSLSETKSRYFKYVLAFFITLLIPVSALPLVLPTFYADESFRVLGTIIVSGVALIFAALFWGAIKGNRAEGPLLAMAIFTCLIIQPVALKTSPSLDEILSPKRQGELIKEYVANGYIPASYKVYNGIYSFYASAKIQDLSKLVELEDLLSSQEKVILAIRLKDWENLNLAQSYGLKELHRQRMAEEKALLLVVKEPVSAPNSEQKTTPPIAPESTAPELSAPSPTDSDPAMPAPNAPAPNAQVPSAAQSPAVQEPLVVGNPELQPEPQQELRSEPQGEPQTLEQSPKLESSF